MTNLGKYNEGQLVYERVAFPTDTETVQAALKKIGIDGIRYEEIFIADYDGDMPKLHKHLGEYESIDELNHLACLLSELDKDELAAFEAVMDSGEYTGERERFDQSLSKPGQLQFLFRHPHRGGAGADVYPGA